MREVAAYTFEENIADATRLGQMLQTVLECPKPVIGRIQGPAFGGGVGLTAVCDLAVAVETASFSLSEVKLGLIPAVIAPFLLRKVPPAFARRYFLTAERIPAAEARQMGLVSEVVPEPADLDAVVEGWVRQLSANAPGAMADCKRLLNELTRPALDEVLPLTAQYNAERRASAEGQEGMKAFLEKRSPDWILDVP
jgi:methylglutaconyl-CoA hydratase